MEFLTPILQRLQRGDPLARQNLGVGRRLEVRAPLEQLVLAQRVVAAVRVVVEDNRKSALRTKRFHKQRRNLLDAIEVQY